MSDLSPALIEELAKALLTSEYEHEWKHWDNLGQYRQQGFCLCQDFTHIVDGHNYESVTGEAAMTAHRVEVAVAPILSRALAEAKHEGAEKMREAAADLMENLIDGEKVPTDWDDWYESRTIEAIPAAIRAIPNPYLTEKEQSQ